MSERQRSGQDPGGSSDTWLHTAVRATLAQSVDGCPDLSDVAAFAEGNLEGGERERFERHVAGCQRCLELLATLARIDEQASIAAEARVRDRRAWWRWLVPATVAATAAGVYLLVQPAEPGKSARVTEEPAQAVVADGRLAERSDQVVGGAVARNEPRPASPPQPIRPAATPPPADAAAPARSKGPEPAAKEEAAPAVPAAPAQADQAQAMPSKGIAASGEARAQASRPAEREPALAEPALTAQAAAPRPSLPDRRELGTTSAAHWVEASAPGGTTRWRFGPGTAVSRSLDGGRTWEPGTTPGGVTAASAPTPAVCWAVGRAGVVIVTSDGVTWRRVPFPDASDLVAVSADDAMAAAVGTATGTWYTTRDGGATWAAVEPR